MKSRLITVLLTLPDEKADLGQVAAMDPAWDHSFKLTVLLFPDQNVTWNSYRLNQGLVQVSIRALLAESSDAVLQEQISQSLAGAGYPTDSFDVRAIDETQDDEPAVS